MNSTCSATGETKRCLPKAETLCHLTSCATVHVCHSCARHIDICCFSRTYARNIEQLRRDGVTHVLNVSQGSHSFPHLEARPSFYHRSRIEYLGVTVVDADNFDISPFFEVANQYIEFALKSGGKVLVHCMQGYSRSPAIVLAYLVAVRGIHLLQAIEIIRRRRPILPNPGFVRRLVTLHNQLAMSGFVTRVDVRTLGLDTLPSCHRETASTSDRSGVFTK